MIREKVEEVGREQRVEEKGLRSWKTVDRGAKITLGLAGGSGL